MMININKSIEIYPSLESIGHYSMLMDNIGKSKQEILEYTRDKYRLAQRYDYEIKGKFEKYITPPNNTIVIIMYCQDYNGNWWKRTGPSDLGGFIGGSEEAQIMLSKLLAERGYWVEVYTSVKLSDKSKVFYTDNNGGCVWYSLESLPYPLNNHPHFDVIISFRTIHSLFFVEENRKYKSILWLHDTPDYINIYGNIEWVRNTIDYIAVVSNFHKTLLHPLFINKARITPNGILDNYLCDGNNNKHSFIFASQPNRGLITILSFWDEIHKTIPDSELHIYYGIHKGWLKYAKKIGFNDDSLIQLIYNINNKPGVIYHGPSNQKELCNGFSNAGFFLYPTEYPEVGCISCMKAMANGAIPITTMNENSVLYNLTKEWDLGILKQPDENREEYFKRFVKRIIGVVDKNWDNHRNKMKKWARDKLRWKYSIDEWEKMINN